MLFMRLLAQTGGTCSISQKHCRVVQIDVEVLPHRISVCFLSNGQLVASLYTLYHSIYALHKHFADVFMVSAATFKSFWNNMMFS